MTQGDEKTEREAYLEALQILRDAQRRELYGDRPVSEDMKAHDERWIAWALKGRTSARLRRGIRDTLEPMMHFPGGWRAQVFSEVRNRTGVDLDEFRSLQLRRVTSIVERGKVQSRSEFAALRSHVDELEGDPAREDELKLAYRLLGEFELSLSNREATS